MNKRSYSCAKLISNVIININKIQSFLLKILETTDLFDFWKFFFAFEKTLHMIPLQKFNVFLKQNKF